MRPFTHLPFIKSYPYLLLMGAVFFFGCQGSPQSDTETEAEAETETAASTPAPAAEDDRFYEMRTYYSPPGKLEDLHTRFRDHTMDIFEKHGMTNVGYWVPVDNKENKLIYILAYPSREARDASWKAFGSDPQWKEVSTASEVNGKIVDRVESVFLQATDYSPAIPPALEGESHVFELRTYTATSGKLEDLHTRFRDHTVELFSKHGMEHVGYWQPVDADKGAGNTLIYILAHDSQEAGQQSFDAFREDPDWVKAKAASEEDGSLTTNVESVYMVPTDYSPIK